VCIELGLCHDIRGLARHTELVLRSADAACIVEGWIVKGAEHDDYITRALCCCLAVFQVRLGWVQLVVTVYAHLHGLQGYEVMDDCHIPDTRTKRLDVLHLVTTTAKADTHIGQHVSHYNTRAHGFDDLLDLAESHAVDVLHTDIVARGVNGLRVRRFKGASVSQCHDTGQIELQHSLVQTRDDTLAVTLVDQPQQWAIYTEELHTLRRKVGQRRSHERGLTTIWAGGDDNIRATLQCLHAVAQYRDVVPLDASAVGDALQQFTDRRIDVAISSATALGLLVLAEQGSKLGSDVDVLAVGVAGKQSPGTARHIEVTQLVDKAAQGNIVQWLAEHVHHVDGHSELFRGGSAAAQAHQGNQLVMVDGLPFREAAEIQLKPLQHHIGFRSHQTGRHRSPQRLKALLVAERTHN
jgi:hypothetical protein